MDRIEIHLHQVQKLAIAVLLNDENLLVRGDERPHLVAEREAAHAHEVEMYAELRQNLVCLVHRWAGGTEIDRAQLCGLARRTHHRRQRGEDFRTVEELQSNLDPQTFWRVHRSYLININRIKEVVPWFKSSYQLKMDDRKQTEIPVSRTQTRKLREMLNL